jgi:putative transposase
MPRRSRIMLSGIPVHIVQRGNNRQQCFHRHEDQQFYLFHLARLLPRSKCALHAYCLMTNHVHLLVTPATPDGCARLMKDIGQLYTQYVNRTYGRSGSLWEGRFRSCLVQAEDYLLACYRYIELNPVRAGLCSHPRAFEWSSYRANADGVPNPLVTPHAEYLRLGNGDQERMRTYRALFEAASHHARVDEIRIATNGNFALGGRAFTQAVSAAIGRRAERGTPGRPSRTREQEADQVDLLCARRENVVCP